MQQAFLDEVTERSGGQITFATHWGGALGTVAEHLALVRDRTVEMVEIPLGANPKELPLTSSFEGGASFGPTDAVVYSKVERMVLDKFPIMAEQERKNNIKTIFIYPWGPLELLSTVPIKTVADLEGKQVMVWGYWYPKLFEPLCGVMSTPAYERYMNLQQGVGDVDVMPASALKGFKTYEVAKYFTYIGIGGKCNGRIYINLDAWNELTPELQEIFMEVGKEKEVSYPAKLMAFERECVKFMETQGVTVYEMSKADRKEWADLLPDLGVEWAEKIEEAGYPGWEIIQYAQDAAEELGFEWLRRWAVR